MPVFIGHRDDVVTTTLGHTVRFYKGKETFVPEIPTVIKACLDRGHAEKVVEAKVEVEPAPIPEPAPVEEVKPTPRVGRGRAAKE